MIRFLCPSCGFSLSAPDDCAGRTSKCSKCGIAVTIPPAHPAPTLSVPEVVPIKEQDSPLTPCSACGRNIAKEAASCPNCGAPNKWVHPEIVRFYQSIKMFNFRPSIQFNYEKFVLVGVDQRSNNDAKSISNLVNSFGVIAPMNLSGLATIVGVRAGQSWVSEWAKRKIKAFRIDFTRSPPSWSSTDDEYWLDVL